MGKFSRSWEITKLSFSVIKQDKELIAFPILSGLFSIAFLLAMLFPSIIARGSSGLDYLVLFIVYLGLSIIATFFNVAVVYTAKKRFSGGNSKFLEAIKFSLSKFHLIIYWGLFSATIGLIIKIIEDKGGTIGTIISKLIGFVWGVAIIFVIPSMVYDNKTPFSAIKQSIQVLKRTWGESIIRVIGLGIIQGTLFFVGGLIFGILLFLSATSEIAFAITMIIGIIYFLLLFLIFGVANQIFNTALYEFASTGRTPTGYNQEILSEAIITKK